MPKAREALAQSDIDEAVAAERDRCAWLCDELAGRWERSATKLRADGSYTTRAIYPLFKKVTCIKPNWRKAADGIEAAAHGLRTVARGIREGWDSPERITGVSATGVSPFVHLDEALRERLVGEMAVNDEAVHGVRLHPPEAYSVSGAARTVWPETRSRCSGEANNCEQEEGA